MSPPAESAPLPLLSEGDDEETLTELWAMRGIDPRRIHTDAGGTVAPAGWTWGVDQRATLVDDRRPRSAETDSGEEEALEGGPLDELVLTRVLGRGGSGVVWLARQPALAREVAVKMLQEEAEEGALAWLLREARVTGALEHPGIVPVHEISEDDEGRPLIVMKRIEGEDWHRVLKADRAALPFGEYLDKHLRILAQVARAAHYAHAKGVLHRDIKPENVMLGAFGEVYLVDWDIAAALERCEVPGLPKAVEVRDLFGTPTYMAPEMVGCTGPDFGPPTDVYLLGATLHEVLTGAPPHRAEDVVRSMTQAYVSAEPRLDEDPARPIPPRLAAVCRRAMRRLPVERIGSAERFAEEIDAFLQHRRALALRRAAERVVRHHVAEGRPEAARVLLDDVDDADPALLAEVERALSQKQQSESRLADIAHDRDIRVGARSRGLGAALLSVGSVALNLVCGALARGGVEIAHREYALAQALNLVWAAVIVLLLRRRVWATTANRQITLTTVLTIASYVAVHLLGAALGVPFLATLVLQCFILGVIWVIGTAAFDRRMIALPVVAFAEMPLIVAWPEWAFEIIGGAVGLGLVLTAAILWRSERR